LTQETLWYKDAIFYELYIRAFKDSSGDGNGDIQGAISKLDYLKELGITCIWVLPTYPSPLVDDGYDISDYYGVHPEYGTIDDFQELIDEVHKRGMRIVTDLVVNHTSDQHPWFQEARKSRKSPFRDYYVWSDSNQKYNQARVIFNDSLDSNWTWDKNTKQFYWHRFYPQQPDLNFDNPKVQAEMLKIIDHWLQLGIDGFRADAVPYLFEREGTNCDNLPETHAFLKKVRNHIDDHFPGRILLVEANQWPEDVLPYFGEGDEAQMAFHFPIMPRIFMALRRSDRSPMVEILARTPPIPEDCQWCTFLRNHDELTLEMVTEEERQWMWEQYAPDSRMRLNLGIRRRLAPLLDNDQRKIKLLNSILFTLPGSPIIYYGDEIGMGDNIFLHDRNGVRTPMQWNNEVNAGFSNAPPSQLYIPVIDSPEYSPSAVSVEKGMRETNSLLHFMMELISLRKSQEALSRGEFRWAELSDENDSLAAYWRYTQQSGVLAIHNLSGHPQVAKIRVPKHFSKSANLLNSKTRHVPPNRKLSIRLEPYNFTWLLFEGS
jgi:maltose alpha-D-glucosyltransferase/alpha-amylase